MQLDVKSSGAVAQVPEYLSAKRYKDLLNELKENIDGTSIRNNEVPWFTEETSDFQQVLFLVVQTLSVNFGKTENIEQNELLEWSLRHLTAKKLLQIWKVCIHRINSHHFAKIIVDVLLSRFAELDRQSENWFYIMYEGPMKMEKEFVEEFNNSNSLPRFLIERLAHIIRFYSKCIEARHLKFSRALLAIFKQFQPHDIELHLLLKVLEDHLPFHPYVVCVNEKSLQRFVYEPFHITQQVAESLMDFINCGKENVPFIGMPPILSSMDVILHVNNYPDQLRETFEGLLYSLFPYMENFDQPEPRKLLVACCNKLLETCTPQSRCLILKRLAEKLKRSRDEFDVPAMLFAWIIDDYKRCFDKPVFRQELGMFYTVLENVQYEDMQAAHSFYNAVITLFQTQLLYKFNIGMAREVKERIIVPIRNQLGDFIELQKLRQKYPEHQASIPVLDDCSMQMIELIIYQISYALEKFTDWEGSISSSSS